MANVFSKKNRRKILVWIIPPIAYIFAQLLFITCKKVLHSNQEAPTTPSIYAAWHGEILLMVFGYKFYTKRNTIDAIISQHSDGEMIARLIQLFGGGTIRGSTSKGGSNVLRGAFKALLKGHDIGITPDGPRGPRHSVADGAAILAMKKHVPVIAINCQPSSFWQINSWDKFCIPKPFSTLHFYFSDPFYVHELSLEEAKDLIQKRLLEHAA